MKSTNTNNDLFQQEQAIIDKNESICADIQYKDNCLINNILVLINHYKNLLRQNKKFISIGDKQQAEIYRINEILAKQNKELEDAYQKIKQQESIIIQQEKLSILGDIVGSTAHEISTPILAITIGLETIQQYMEAFLSGNDNGAIPNATARYQYFTDLHISFTADMGLLFKAVEMIRSQINNMKSFIKFQETIQDFDVNTELNTTINIMNYKTLSNMEVHKKFADNLPLIRGNAAQINQVFMNLIKNAVEAKKYKGSGSLTITTYKKDEKIIVEFSDNGKGIDKQQLDNLFNEGLTESNGKTGRGLALCKEIIKQHNGMVEVESALDIGTTFRIILN